MFLTLFVNNFVDTNLATITVEEVYDTLNDISGDTAMRDEYYCKLEGHFKQFAEKNDKFAFVQQGEWDTYKLSCVLSAKQKAKLVQDYIGNYTYTQDEIVLNNEIA